MNIAFLLMGVVMGDVKPTILEVSPYRAPEKFSNRQLVGDLEESFVAAGYGVVDYVPTPSRGLSREERRAAKKKRQELLHDGAVSVKYFPMVSEGTNPIQRAVRYLLSGVIQYRRASKERGASVIFAASTPPTQGLLCGRLKKKLGIPFVYNLQDVFPDSLVNAGLTQKGSFLWKIGSKIERYTYEKADAIIVASEGMRRNLLSKGVPDSKMTCVSNWVDTDAVYPVPQGRNHLVQELELASEGMRRNLLSKGVPDSKMTCVSNWVDTDAVYPVPQGRNHLVQELELNPNVAHIVYGGNLGESQNVGIIADVAKSFLDDDRADFIVFGDGSKKDLLLDRIEKEGLTNLRVFPMRPPSEVAEVYSLALAALVPCKKGVGAAAFPSKTWSILATGTPVLASYDSDSDLTRFLEGESLGLCSEAEDVEALSANVTRLLSEEGLAAKMGEKARRYAEANLSKKKCTAKYLAVIEKTIRNGM